PYRINTFNKCQIENNQPLAVKRRIVKHALCWRRIKLGDDPLRDNAAVHDRVIHRLRFAAMLSALSGKYPFSAMMRFSIHCISYHQAIMSWVSTGSMLSRTC